MTSAASGAIPRESSLERRLKRPRFPTGRPGIALLSLLVGFAAPLPFTAGAATNAFEPEIRAFESADSTNPPPKNGILFIGSSSIRLWKTLAADFPGLRTINRGFGGSQIADSIHYAERIVIPYAPRQIVMYAGGNDINAGKSSEEALADFQKFVERVHRSLPETRIAYISIAPNPARWSQVDRVRRANELIADFTRKDPRLSFITVFAAMLGPDGKPRPELFVEDQLHMNSEGYKLWREIVGKHLGQAGE